MDFERTETRLKQNLLFFIVIYSFTNPNHPARLRIFLMNITGKKIIIFDDDEDILSVCTYVLEEQGWDVHVFTDCNQVIEKVSGLMPDVIMMDNWIPDTGGIAATQTVKNSQALKHIPVVYFSANSDIQLLAKQAGAEAYIAKPFDLDDMERVIKSVLPPSPAL